MAEKMADWKYPHFFANSYETWSKWLAHRQVILLEYHLGWIRIVEFLLLATFCASLDFFSSVFIIDITKKVAECLNFSMIFVQQTREYTQVPEFC